MNCCRALRRAPPPRTCGLSLLGTTRWTAGPGIICSMGHRSLSLLRPARTACGLLGALFEAVSPPRTLASIFSGSNTGKHARDISGRTSVYAPASKFTSHAPLESSSRDTVQHEKPTIQPDLDSDPLPEQLRSIMRLLSHSVVLCTSNHDGVPRGMTMSSFTSLALSPTPLVSFNIAAPSRTLDAIAWSRHFNVHVLAGNAHGAALADHFTRGNSGAGASFQGLDYKMLEVEEASGQAVVRAPRLGGDAVLYVLQCRLSPEAPNDGLVRVRDHMIVVGEITSVLGERPSRQFGLAYGDRQYREVGRRVTSKNAGERDT